MKINQIIDELGSLDNERNPRTSMIVDDDDVDDVQVVVWRVSALIKIRHRITSIWFSKKIVSLKAVKMKRKEKGPSFTI